MYARAGFIYHVDSLVWEVAVGDIALCQFDTCLESLVCISHTVVLLVMSLDVVQYQQGLFACSRFNDNLLETALQGSVLLNALAILISVVAPIHWMIPLARAGFRMLAESQMSPLPEPAPIMV